MSEWEVIARAMLAAIGGGLIGVERSYRGRAAGMRTNALVGLGAALLVAVAIHAPWIGMSGSGDPTRVIQGIVTGIGFLGAGVIIKDGFSVRGLTTAASVWVVAAIGVLFGGGLYVAGSVSTVIALVALDLLRRVENFIPVTVQCEIGFPRQSAPDDRHVTDIVRRHGFRVTEMASRLDPATNIVEFELVMWSKAEGAARALERDLRAHPEVASFRLTPTRD
jgi:putative Mg2+ transporter-C (MgtC) family protein